MTKDELFALLGTQDIHQEMDVKLVVLDLLRERLDLDEITELFWKHLPGLDAEFIADYFYRKRGS